MKLQVWAALFAAGLAVSGARAAQTTYYFGGTISIVSTQPAAPNFLNEAFSGSFTFDSAALDQNGNPQLGVYDPGSITASVAGHQYFGEKTVGGAVTVSAGSFAINSFKGPYNPSQSSWVVTNTGPTLSNYYRPYYLSLELKDNTFQAFSTLARPGSVMTLTTFSDTKMYFSWFTPSEQQAYIGGNLSYLSTTAPVPEPETYAMLLTGLGLVGGIVRRRRVK